MKWSDSVCFALAFCFIQPSLCVAGSSFSTELKRLDFDFMAYSIAAEDLDGDGSTEIIVGSFDHQIHVLGADSRILWSYPVGGLPYALGIGDLNSDGRNEIVAVVHTDPSRLVALEYQKGPLWSFVSDLPLLSVAVGDLEGDGNREIAAGSFLGGLYVLDAGRGTVKMRRDFPAKTFICALAFGDIGDSAGQELVVGTSRMGIFILDSEARILHRIKANAIGKKAKNPKRAGRKTEKGKQAEATKREKKQQSHPRYKMEKIQSILITDLTGDGKQEIVVGSRPCGLVTVLNNKGEEIWQRNFPHIMNKTSSAIVTVGNFIDRGSKELFCLFNGVVLSGRKGISPAVLLDANGVELSGYYPGSAFFSACSALLDGSGHHSVVLSSSVRGKGATIVSFESEGPDALSEFKDASSVIIEPSLQKMNEPLAKHAQSTEGRRFHFLYRCNYKDIYGRNSLELKRFLQPISSIPGDNAIVLTSMYERTRPGRMGKGKRRELLERASILSIISWFETNRIPFFLNIGKHAKLYFSLETLDALLQRARTYCRGFIVDENSYTRTAQWRDFLPNLDRIMGILSKYPGKKLIMNEYLGFWHRFPLDRNVYNVLLNPRYKDILVPIYKPNNVKSPELNLGVIVGLWKAGAVQDWGVGIYGDMWKWASVFMSTPGDVLLRFVLEAISLGANYFVAGRNVSENSQDVLDLDPTYKTYFEVLYRLIASGVISPVERAQDLVVCPVALQEFTNPNEIRNRTAGTQIYWQEIYRMQGLLDGGFVLQTVRENYLPRHYYRMSSYYEGLVPRNPHGYVLLFPESIDPARVGGIEEFLVIRTDGKLYGRGRKALVPIEFSRISEVFGKYESKMPIRSSDAFVSAHRKEGGYTVYLINPFLFETKDVAARLTLNPGEKSSQIIDMISGEKLQYDGQSLEINIPSGLFRIIEISHD
jgi:hypothetical protein